MIRLVIALFVLAACATTVEAVEQSERFALIVTNNRSQSASRPDLHYADDDGVQYAELFGELIGRQNVTLLTKLDAETAALHPGTDAREPTHAQLRAAVQQLAEKLQSARADHRRVVVYLVFAGHGDLDRGQGYIDLSDGRLTSRELDDTVIAPLGADRIHLILDSCNSYFLLNPRKPGGKRWQSDQTAPRDLLSKYPQLGAVLSTSAEAVTYEWSELQSGVFSYEVRAGLRGAADVNGDGKITYAELSAFIRVANQPVVNDLYRPKVFSRNPSADAAGAEAVLMQLPALTGRRLQLGAADGQRLTLRDPQGVRVMDVNKEAGTALSLTLPSGIALLAQQQVAGGDRPRFVDRDLPEGEQHFEALPARDSDQLGRGDPPLFRMLFAEPFGQRAFARAQAESKLPSEPPSGVTQRDVERLRLHLTLMSNYASELRTELGMTLLSCTAIPTGALTYAIYRASDHRGDWIPKTGIGTGLILSAVTLGIGIYFLATHWSEERFAEVFSHQDFSTERARSAALPKAELKLKTLAEESRRGRDIGMWVLVIGGAVLAADGGFLIGQDLSRHNQIALQGPLNIVMGLAEMAFGWYIGATMSPLEHTWAAYSRDPAVTQRLDE